MKIGLVLTPLNDLNLKLASQIGVTDVVYYHMEDMPSSYSELLSWKNKIAEAGLTLSVIEGGPPMDQIVLAKPGRDDQIAYFKECLVNMGKAGIPVLCYSFMPWSLRVARTSYQTPIRGEALTSSFDFEKWDDNFRTEDGETTSEEMWENLSYFLKAVLPTAEQAGVKLALHPDDPPINPLCGLARIFSEPRSFDRLIDMAKSPSNGITMCQGTFAEMDADVPALIERFSEHIHFAHFRDIRGDSKNFVEVFQDDGKTDMFKAMQAYHKTGYTGVIRPDHVPLLINEQGHDVGDKAEGYFSGKASGYTMLGRLFAVGYMRGLIEAVEKSDN